jgi:hypothetical protein
MTKTPQQLALVLEGVSTKWQANVLQLLATPTSVNVAIDGHGVINPTAFVLSKEQARQLAAQIIELLGPEDTH